MPFLTVRPDHGTPVKLYYDDHRPADATGSPVVLVHGWLQSGATWTYQIADLVAAGHRVITYDRRGFGRSAKPGSGYDFDTFADDLDHVLVGLDLQGAALVGLSNGGGDVVRWLSSYGGGRVDKVVLASATPPRVYRTPHNPAGALTDDGITFVQQSLRSDWTGFVEHMVADMLTPTGGTALGSRAERDAAVASALQASTGAAVDCVAAWRTDFRPDLAAIDVPVLVVHGDRDHVLPVELTGLRTHEAVAGSSLVLIKGGPHAVHLTHPAEFNRALREFLNG